MAMQYLSWPWIDNCHLQVNFGETGNHVALTNHSVHLTVSFRGPNNTAKNMNISLMSKTVPDIQHEVLVLKDLI